MCLTFADLSFQINEKIFRKYLHHMLELPNIVLEIPNNVLE